MAKQRTLEIKVPADFDEENEHAIVFSVSCNGLPYLSVKASESSIGTPLTVNHARRMRDWLDKYLDK